MKKKKLLKLSTLKLIFYSYIMNHSAATAEDEKVQQFGPKTDNNKIFAAFLTRRIILDQMKQTRG